MEQAELLKGFLQGPALKFITSFQISRAVTKMLPSICGAIYVFPRYWIEVMHARAPCDYVQNMRNLCGW